MAQRWKKRPEGSNWGEFGDDDQRGRLNLLTREKVLQGIAEVKEGLSFCLSLPLDLPGGNLLNPRRHPPRRAATLRGQFENFNFPLQRENPINSDVICDDAVLIYMQYSTQWDSLAHAGSLFDADGDGTPEPVYYNGWRAGEHIRGAAAEKAGAGWARYEGTAAVALGIENMAEACVQGRGVMIDLHAHFSRARKLVTYEDIARICDVDGVVVEPGDMLCLHTGFGAGLLEMKGNPDPDFLHGACAVLDGRDKRLLQWITDSQLSVLIADNYAVEDVPARILDHDHGQCAMLPLHEHCLFKLGIHLGEIWHLTELAHYLRKHNRSRFLLTAPPLRLPYAVGSPVTPIATV